MGTADFKLGYLRERGRKKLYIVQKIFRSRALFFFPLKRLMFFSQIFLTSVVIALSRRGCVIYHLVFYLGKFFLKLGKLQTHSDWEAGLEFRPHNLNNYIQGKNLAVL
jgi:hypothetical protein